jgi:hypothetical protein
MCGYFYESLILAYFLIFMMGVKEILYNKVFLRIRWDSLWKLIGCVVPLSMY